MQNRKTLSSNFSFFKNCGMKSAGTGKVFYCSAVLLPLLFWGELMQVMPKIILLFIIQNGDALLRNHKSLNCIKSLG